MMVPTYQWPVVSDFVDRADERELLARWWADDTREPLAMSGRRRVGKSWLFRRFAHGKPAVILVAEQLPAASQLARYATILEPVLGVRPDLADVQSLFRVLFRLSRDAKTLVVIDEFPWLLGTSRAEVERTLSSIQAVMEEERGDSSLKLILCGSQVEQMEALFREKNPMHGRLRRFTVRPLPFGEASLFLDGLEPLDAFERYSVAGGMPNYLSKLSTGTLRAAVCREVLDKDSPLFDEGRVLIEQELREPRVYFAILEQLAGGAKAANVIGRRMGAETNAVTKYLTTLAELRLVSRHDTFGAAANARTGRWRLDDEFLRFWFRFVFPFQSDLESGLDALDVFDAEVSPVLPEHTSAVFESWCLQWLRRNRAEHATRFGTWWGNAANEFRRTNERTTEEVDGVGSKRGRVTLVCEAKWTNKALTPAIVADIETFKLPAIRQAGMKVSTSPRIVLFSKSGYTAGLRDLSIERGDIELVDVGAALADVAEA